jgi:hypothetical protein
VHYIREHLHVSDELEIWSIWMGDIREAIIETKSQDELTVKDIQKVLGEGYYEAPRCLKIGK